MSTSTATVYQQIIARHVHGIDPRHVEAYLRLEYGTLDGFAFNAHTLQPFAAVAAHDPAEAEALAVSFGL